MKRPEAERLLEKIRRGEPYECWPWIPPYRGRYPCFENALGRSEGAHRAVYRVFIGPIPRGLTIRHLCGNKRCCNPRHLVPGTMREQAEDNRMQGSLRVGALVGTSKLTEAQAKEVIQRYCVNMDRPCDIAKDMGVHYGTVLRCAKGMTWGHLERPVTPRLTKSESHLARGSHQGSRHPNASLTEERVAAMKGEYIPNRVGELTRIAKKYRIPVSTASNIISGVAWAHVVVVLGSRPSKDKPYVPKKVHGSGSPNAKLTEKKVVQMRRERAAGVPTEELARKYKVSGGVVSAICVGREWKQVGGPRTRGRLQLRGKK